MAYEIFARDQALARTGNQIVLTKTSFPISFHSVIFRSIYYQTAAKVCFYFQQFLISAAKKVRSFKNFIECQGWIMQFPSISLFFSIKR